MKRPYRIVHDTSTASSRELADWLAKDGQLLVPLVELLEKGERAIDEVIDVMGRATVEAVLQMSAEQVAGPKAQGRRGPDREVYWHGVQGGRVALKERQLRVARPRLRKKRRRADESGEVEVPAYTALRADQRLADRMLELVLNGVSTRRYEQVLPAMADQVGISKSEVSRETIEAGTRVLQELAERDLGELDVLVVYLDGIVIRKVEQYAAWLEREWPSAAASLREGLAELFTVNRLGLPAALRRCLTTTNIIDSSHAGVRQHTRRVSRWRNGVMAVRWAATTFCETEKNFRRVTGYQHLWMLKAHLDDEDGALAEMEKAG